MTFRPDDPADDQAIVEATREVAASIVTMANRNTDAPAGFTYEVRDGYLRLGPTGAAGLPIEVGTRHIPARSPFKKALDRHRVDG